MLPASLPLDCHAMRSGERCTQQLSTYAKGQDVRNSQILSILGWLFFLIHLLGPARSVYAQTGIIYGSIHDQESGEELVGANVLIVGTTRGASTDLDGKYTIANVPAGAYTLRISLVGYAIKVVSGVQVRDGGSLKLDVNILPEAYSADEVVVEAQRLLSTEASVLAERKRAAVIGDGISAEMVKRTSDATSGDALKRVTGISIVENKFVFVRGITDRYNGTTLDGAPVASTEAGKKGFSFDLLPAGLIENTVVVKSTTPNLPGDFTGGLVQLNTLDFPEKSVVKLSLSSSFNSATTSKTISASQGGTRDWLGFDDGTRDLPPEKPSATEMAEAFPNTWSPRARKAPVNTSFSASYGDRVLMSPEDASSAQLGWITALTYRSTFQRNDRIIDDRDQGRFSTGARDDYSVLWGAIGNVSYKFLGHHKISMKNSFNQSGEDRVSLFNQSDISNSLTNRITMTSWTQRSVYTGQIIGDHVFSGFGGLTAQWRASVSTSTRKDPDKKEVVYYQPIDDPASPFTVGYNKRSWAQLTDKAKSVGIDLTLPVAETKIKAGGLLEWKDSDYRIRYFRGQADYIGGASESLTTLPLSSIFLPQNFGPGKFTVSEISQPSDSYMGDQKLAAGYLMLDLPFELLDRRFRFVGGVRIEDFEQNVSVPKTREPNGPVTTDGLSVTDILPSFNLTYAINEVTNLRLAYSHSVNRPEFRERARTIWEDFVLNEIVGGNPNLARAYVRNYDIRFEVFPGVGEVFAASFFLKDISGAIEEQLLFSGTRTRVFFNSGSTQNRGWEVEARKSLDFLGGYFRNFSITGNYTRIFSRVEFIETVGNSTDTRFQVATRPMQGQAPYMMNLSLFCTEPTLATTVSILYNKFGRRLHTVGFLASDIYEEPRDIVDISVTQPIAGILESKFTVRNLNGKPRLLTRDGLRYDQTDTGTSYSLQFSVGF